MCIYIYTHTYVHIYDISIIYIYICIHTGTVSMCMCIYIYIYMYPAVAKMTPPPHPTRFRRFISFRPAARQNEYVPADLAPKLHVESLVHRAVAFTVLASHLGLSQNEGSLKARDFLWFPQRYVIKRHLGMSLRETC